MNMPIPMKMTHRHRPLWQLWNGVNDTLFLQTNFPQYNSEPLPIILRGYHKAFDQYYIFRLTHMLYQLRKNLGLFQSDKRPQFESATKENLDLENSILVENFIVLLQVLMDQIAVYIPFFFTNMDQHRLLIRTKEETKKGNFKSFAQIRKIFSSNRTIDSELSSYMGDEMAWFEEINDMRNSLIHGAGWLWIESSDFGNKDSKFKIVKGLLSKKDWVPSSTEFVACAYYNFREFLSFYEKHFRQKCVDNLKEFQYGANPYWQTADSSFYQTMDYFYDEGKRLNAQAR